MANTFVNTTWVAPQILDIIQPNMLLAGSINSDYSSEFGKESMKVGSSILVPLPQQFIGRTGAPVNLESLSDRTTPVTLTTQYGVDFQVTSKELKLNVQDATKRYIKPAGVNIAAKIDRDVASMMALTCPNQAGVLGTTWTDDSVIRNAQVMLDENEAPFDDDRWIVINSRQEQSALKVTGVNFNDQKELGQQYKRNRMGTALGFQWGMSQNVPRLTSGTYSGTPVVAGANQTGNTLNLSGFTAGNVLNQGDKFTLAGVYGTEVIGKTPNAGLQQFTITQAVTVPTGGAVTVNVYPSITAVGQYQNVSNPPANTAAVTFLNPSAVTGATGFAYHKDSYTLAFTKLDEPKDVHSCRTFTDEDSGVSIRAMVFYSGMADTWTYRFDTMYAVSPLYPQWCVNLAAA